MTGSGIERRRVRLPGGLLEVHVPPGVDALGASEAAVGWLGPLAFDPSAAACARTRRVSGPENVRGLPPAFVKAAPLSPSGARRHGRARLWGRAAPRVRELHHLEWLRSRLFRVPRPLFAATLHTPCMLVHQALATEVIPGARPFAPDDARELAEEFGRELGRMHALGFLHADLYTRNVLVAAPEHGAAGGRRLVWIDCWAGGPGHSDGRLARHCGRALVRDLGTWASEAADTWARADQARFLTAYLAARVANGRPVQGCNGLLAAVAAERRRELRRLERDPARLRGQPFPTAGWTPPTPS
jgi:hypothetical protein